MTAALLALVFAATGAFFGLRARPRWLQDRLGLTAARARQRQAAEDRAHDLATLLAAMAARGDRPWLPAELAHVTGWPLDTVRTLLEDAAAQDFTVAEWIAHPVTGDEVHVHRLGPESLQDFVD